ncbi:MAG: hypothetical protein IFNCLDLE_01098 [Ignavibacteriaceae bacterium]|nr:hypothetical protein [Ignavibacteriaceae bacterium]
MVKFSKTVYYAGYAGENLKDERFKYVFFALSEWLSFNKTQQTEELNGQNSC